MKVLIDRSIERYAVTHNTRMVPQTVEWGPHEITQDVATRVHKQPGATDVFNREQIPYLVSLCNSAREGRLEFCTSFELHWEALRQQPSTEGLLGIDWSSGIRLTKVPCPVKRESVSKVIDPLVDFGKDVQLGFLRGIQNPRFLFLRRTLGDAQLADAFHLWTAEGNSLDAFLTMDQKFWNNVDHRRNAIDSPVCVVTPKQLCEQLGLAPSDVEELATGINPFF